MEQTSVYVARGLLIESVAPTWLYSTASEHAVFYQYNFHKAKKVFAGMTQTESPYYQPTPKPAPFDAVVGVFLGDPSYECKKDDKFNGCDESWGVIIERSENIFVAGAGVYSWFSTYFQDCTGGQWPKVPIHLIVGGQDNLPAVEICFYDSLDCFVQPWEYGNKPWPYPGGTGIGDPEDDDSWGDDGPTGDEMIACSPTTKSTTTTTTTSDTPSETPPLKPSPRAGDPALNKRDCYKNTRGINRDQAADLIGRFCGEVERQLLTSGQEYANQWPYSPPK
ncbi:hypothetical protein PWT90_07209 [Aphanocladium album]|nr:hypothetical protein PWT90_07209 [Aphanocladium album]